MSSTPSILEAVAAARYWSWIGDAIRPHELRDGSDCSHYPLYTMEELAKVDKRLPAMVRDLIEPTFSGNWLRLLFEYVLPNGLVIPNGAPVKNIESMQIDMATNKVRIDCTDFRFRKGDAVKKPVGTRPRFVNVDRAWLDLRYPGWENRYATAKSLDMEPADLTAFIVEAKPAPGAARLSDITFD